MLFQFSIKVRQERRGLRSCLLANNLAHHASRLLECVTNFDLDRNLFVDQARGCIDRHDLIVGLAFHRVLHEGCVDSWYAALGDELLVDKIEEHAAGDLLQHAPVDGARNLEIEW